MKTDSIRDQVKQYYEKQQMPSESAARLASILLDGAPSKSSVQRPTFGRRFADWVSILRSRLIPAMGTAFAVMVLINLSVWYHWHASSELNLNNRIAREIAMNHNKNLEPEYQAISIEALGPIMPALDFVPFSPPLLNKMGLELKGARYCSIQGHLALQMKFRDATGQRHTIYQAPCLPPLQGIHQAKLSINNVHITMWQENGIFIGLASQ